MAMTAQGLMLSLAGVSVASMMAFHARSKRADLIRARKVSTACPPAIWTLLTKVETSCDRILIAGGANVEAEWEQGPAV